jgi:hypothetical protein
VVALPSCLVRFAMKQSSFSLLFFAFAVSARAADATSPIDFTQRNESLTPATAVTTPKKDSPQKNDSVQQKRVDKPMVDKQTAPLSDRRAAITLQEAREKSVREKESRRPETLEQPTSAFNHKQAAISTNADTAKPPIVAKYQDRMTTATPWGPGAATGNTAKFSATDTAAAAKINRFVFRKNPHDTSAATDGAAVTPAAGGATIKK